LVVYIQRHLHQKYQLLSWNNSVLKLYNKQILKSFDDIVQLLTQQFGESIILQQDTNPLMPSITVPVEQIAHVCSFVHSHEDLYFDSLSCLTGLDNGPETNTLEVVYNLYSIPYEYKLCLRVITDRTSPKVPSVSNVWLTADWHEREAYDLLGIEFSEHPDLRRILLPEDWQGHPLRKDYQPQEEYHGIQVKY
jgi:NADH-quinone oxidoreductase subunit C